MILSALRLQAWLAVPHAELRVTGPHYHRQLGLDHHVGHESLHLVVHLVVVGGLEERVGGVVADVSALSTPEHGGGLVPGRLSLDQQPYLIPQLAHLQGKSVVTEEWTLIYLTAGEEVPHGKVSQHPPHYLVLVGQDVPILDQVGVEVWFILGHLFTFKFKSSAKWAILLHKLLSNL